MNPNCDASFRDKRWGSAADYAYGPFPNEFLAAVARRGPAVARALRRKN